jgi:glycosyltransferase 2 family protein
MLRRRPELQAVTGVIAIRKALTTALRLLVTAGLLLALAARFDLGRAAELMGQASLSVLLATIIVLFAANLIVGLRWHLVLSAAAPSPGPVILMKIVCVGLFFNQLLPTGVGGDAVRAWRCRKIGIGLGSAIRSVLLDRATGYAVLVALYAASLPSLLHLLPEPRQRAGLVVVLFAALLGLLALGILDYLPRFMLRLRVLAPLAELSRESRRLFTHPVRGGAVMALSTLTIGSTILAFKLAGDSIGISLSFASWLMIVPPVTLIQLLPVSLAGWGVREVALVFALACFGVAPEAALAASVLMGLCQILSGFPGGVFWLTGWDIAGAQVDLPEGPGLSVHRASSSSTNVG